MMEAGKRKSDVVALKLPLSVSCNTCSFVMHKNTEINFQEESSREEPGGTPTPILMFDCTMCSASIAVKTDGERRTFCVASGATRVFRTRKGMSEEEYIASLYREAMQRRSLFKNGGGRYLTLVRQRDMWVKMHVNSGEEQGKCTDALYSVRERIEELDEKIPFDELPLKNRMRNEGLNEELKAEHEAFVKEFKAELEAFGKANYPAKLKVTKY